MLASATSTSTGSKRPRARSTSARPWPFPWWSGCVKESADQVVQERHEGNDLAVLLNDPNLGDGHQLSDLRFHGPPMFLGQERLAGDRQGESHANHVVLISGFEGANHLRSVLDRTPITLAAQCATERLDSALSGNI